MQYSMSICFIFFDARCILCIFGLYYCELIILRALFMKQALILILLENNMVKDLILCETEAELKELFVKAFTQRGLTASISDIENAHVEFDDGTSVSMATAYPQP
jgi:hypothetical protein